MLKNEPDKSSFSDLLAKAQIEIPPSGGQSPFDWEELFSSFPNHLPTREEMLRNESIESGRRFVQKVLQGKFDGVL